MSRSARPPAPGATREAGTGTRPGSRPTTRAAARASAYSDNRAWPPRADRRQIGNRAQHGVPPPLARSSSALLGADLSRPDDCSSARSRLSSRHPLRRRDRYLSCSLILSRPARAQASSRSPPGAPAAPSAPTTSCRSPCLVTIEQSHAELLLEIGDRVADRRCSAPEPTARRRETARLDHRKENGELIEAGHPRSLHFKFLERHPQYFMAITERGECVSPGRTV